MLGLIDYKIEYAYYLGGYFVIAILLSLLSRRIKNSFFSKTVKVFCFPFMILALLAKIILPIFTLLFNAFILFALTIGVPLSLFYFFDFGLQKTTIFFICFTFGTIMSAYCAKVLLTLVVKISSTIDSDKKDAQILEDLTALFYTKEFVIFFIFLFYCIFLIMMSFMKIQCAKPLFSENIDLALLQSFLVFIAFTNMVVKSKDVLLTPKSILAIYLKYLSS